MRFVTRHAAKVSHPTSLAVAFAVAIAAVLCAMPAWALPQGGVVQAGAAKIVHLGPKALVIIHPRLKWSSNGKASQSGPTRR